MLVHNTLNENEQVIYRVALVYPWFYLRNINSATHHIESISAGIWCEETSQEET